MPELPDIVVYLEALEKRLTGRRLERVRINSPFLVRTFESPLAAVEDKRVVELKRLGKRIAIGLEDGLWLVVHLMIAGRLHWRAPGAKLAGKYNLAAFDFATGTLVLTEGGAKRRAALWLVQGDDSLQAHDPGGIDALAATRDQFTAALRTENHTLKRALTDPRLLGGIGNAYSDEILHRARLSPLALSQKLSAVEIERLYAATREVLAEWIDRLRDAASDEFPEKVTAFRPDMAVHGRYGKPCPVCGTPVQRIRYADNETNYCPRCQSGGRMLADRSLSRLLRDAWPKNVDEL
jgi:formamidopyrimidine-DNA glycosylase